MKKELVFKILTICLIGLFTIIGTITTMIIRHTSKPNKEIGIFLESNNSILRNVLKPDITQEYYGIQAKIPKTTIRINSLGFRGKETTLEKPDEVKRILVLGDSFTFGMGVEENETFPHHLETLLGKTGQDWEVLNFGVPGYNTIQEAELFKVKGLAYSPDIVILYVLDNDNIYMLDLSPEEEQRMQNNEKNLRDKSLVEQEFLLISEPILELKEMSQEHRFELLIIDHTGIFRNYMEKFCIEEDIPRIVFDFSKDNKTMILSKKDPHPSKKTNRILGELVFERLKIEGLV